MSTALLNLLQALIEPPKEQQLPGRDLFDFWLAQQGPFSLSEIPPEREAEFQEFAKDQGLDPDNKQFDARGSFLAGDTRDEAGHLGSIGVGGKILKSPDHPTAFKTALVEMLRNVGAGPSEIEGALSKDRSAAAQETLQRILGLQGDPQQTPEEALTLIASLFNIQPQPNIFEQGLGMAGNFINERREAAVEIPRLLGDILGMKKQRARSESEMEALGRNR